ncbi:MAG TPA: chalcone isomerase family protein [Albitalea sp.]|nr:chalcone isomerase family protein [Albitalea sp.]
MPIASRADTVDAGGVKFETVASLGNARLQLNGAGVRYKAVFKVYAAGLYLSAKESTAEAVLAATGPRRMHIVMLREIDANELGKLFTKGMEQNASREEFSKVIPGVIKMSEIFSQRKKLASGDSFSIDYVPGTGSVILVNGKPASEPIKEPEFFNALMKIWLGKVPADAQLKDALLGAKPAGAKDPFN